MSLPGNIMFAIALQMPFEATRHGMLQGGVEAISILIWRAVLVSYDLMLLKSAQIQD